MTPNDTARRRPRDELAQPARVARRLVVATAVIAAIVVAAGVGGVARAAWLSLGAGTGAAQAGTALAPTTSSVAGSAITSGLLFPGGTGAVAVTVANPNPYPVTLSSIVGSGLVTATGGRGTCSTTGVGFTAQSPGTAIPANGSVTVTLPGAATMSTASEVGCQGATFTIPVTVQVTSA